MNPLGLSSEGNDPSTWGTGVKMAIHKPLVVGLTGRTKPRSLEDFLNEFVADVQAALKNGVVVNGCNHSRHTLFCLRCAGACICQI